MSEEMACKNCFYMRLANPLSNKSDMNCHRLPPNCTVNLLPGIGRDPITGQQTQTFQPIPSSAWPMVKADQWCGEFKPQKPILDLKAIGEGARKIANVGEPV